MAGIEEETDGEVRCQEKLETAQGVFILEDSIQNIQIVSVVV